MRILHTADLHLGRQFDGHSLDDDHAHVLDQICDALRSEKPDALIIAGDIFDRTTPSETAVELFNDFMQRVVRETSAAIVLIAGNHDSGERIGSMSLLADRTRALVRGPLWAKERSLILHDTDGPVVFSGLPFGYHYAARQCFGDIAIDTPADLLARQVASAKDNVPQGARWVITAHAFVSGGSVSESERALTRVGGVETVSASVFEGAHYVALGHLHRPQTVAHDHITYSGSPLPFSFAEEGQVKGMQLVEIDGAGRVVKHPVPFSLRRQVRTLEGRLHDILAQPDSQDFIQVRLTDEERPVDPMRRLQKIFPYACSIDCVNLSTAAPGVVGRASRLDDPLTVVREFMAFSRSNPPKPDEDVLVATALDKLGGGA